MSASQDSDIFVSDEVIEEESFLGSEDEKIKYELPSYFAKPDNKRLDGVIASQDANALRRLPPLAFAATLRKGFDLSDNDIFITPSVEIAPVVNPLLNATLLRIGAIKRGERTYSVGTGNESDPRILEALVEALPGEVCYPESVKERLEKGGIQSVRRYEAAKDLADETFYATELRARWQQARLYRNFTASHPTSGALSGALVMLSAGKGQMYAKICTAPTDPRLGLHFYSGAPDLNLYTLEGRKNPLLVTPDVALSLLDTIEQQGYEVLDPSGSIATLRDAFADMVVAQRVPASPGEALIAVGKRVKAIKGIKLPASEKGKCVRTAQITAQEVGKIISEAKGIGARVAVHSHVRDVARMGVAKRAEIEGLRPYQNDAVAVQLASEVGYVNASGPGLGKTVMALAALRHKANMMTSWRGVVACPAAILTQWSRECARFFPEAQVEMPTAKDIKAGKLMQAHSDTGQTPLLALVSYDTARRHWADLAKIEPDDLIVDEAAILKNPSSDRTKSLWALRKRAKVGVALTGTPIEKSLDDLGRILAWARDDEHLFHGARLSQRFDVTDKEGVKALWRAIGPCVFRRDRSEIASELPIIQTESVVLDPTPAEFALADGARRELRRIYQELQEKIAAMATIDPTNPKLILAKEDLSHARGAALGGITLARMAASDPQAVAISKSAGAALLQSAGLVQPALEGGGTKRTQIVNLVAELADNDEAVLIFTDFSEIADHLAGDLAAKGVSVGVFKGGQTKKVRDRAALGFQGQPCKAHSLSNDPVEACPDCMQPNLDCLVLTQAGREGLNFQRASVLIHYDLPWMPSQVVQRVGRASRFGAGNKHLSVLIPVMAGTIEERVAAVLVPRAVIALQALDTHRGVKGSQTEIGLAIAGIEDTVSAEERKGQETIFELAKKVLGD